MVTATRRQFLSIVNFCIRYDYIGAQWDGLELTCHSWRRQNPDNYKDDITEPCSSAGLSNYAQQIEWRELENRLQESNIAPFSWGFVSTIFIHPDCN